MIKEIVKDIDGNNVYFLTPENDKDIAFLRKMEKKNKISSNASFGDWKKKKEGK